MAAFATADFSWPLAIRVATSENEANAAIARQSLQRESGDSGVIILGILAGRHSRNRRANGLAKTSIADSLLQLGVVMELKTIDIHGHQPGPRLLITAGVHGDEFEPMAAVRRFMTEIDPRHLRGTLTLAPDRKSVV